MDSDQHWGEMSAIELPWFLSCRCPTGLTVVSSCIAWKPDRPLSQRHDEALVARKTAAMSPGCTLIAIPGFSLAHPGPP